MPGIFWLLKRSWAGRRQAFDALVPIGTQDWCHPSPCSQCLSQIVISVFFRVLLAAPALPHLGSQQGDWSSLKGRSERKGENLLQITTAVLTQDRENLFILLHKAHDQSCKICLTNLKHTHTTTNMLILFRPSKEKEQMFGKLEMLGSSF